MSKAKIENAEKIVATNRKAFHDFFLLDKFEAGMALTGTEVKSLRAGRVNLKDSYVRVRRAEAWLMQAHISPYEQGNRENHDPLRERRLLLHRSEIRKLSIRISERGLTVIPLRVYFKAGRAKIEIAVAKGKRLYDKRETKRRETVAREVQAAIKHHRR